VVAMFDDPVELGDLVGRALANWRVDRITAELVAAKEAAAGHEARAAELERPLAEGQQERVALRTAVQALDERAKAPDAPPKYQRALDLLRAGRTAEAETIFSEVVANRQAEGAAALKEAAEAARHLGALAYLDDTKKAIEAYPTATRLDPDHPWSWLFLGRLHRQAGDLPAAEQAFRRAREAAEHAGDERASWSPMASSAICTWPRATDQARCRHTRRSWRPRDERPRATPPTPCGSATSRSA